MKTRFIAVLLCAVLALTLSACGGKDNEKDTSETTGTSSVTETEGKETTSTTDNTEKKETEGEIVTEKTGGTDSGKTETDGNTSETSKPSGGNTSGGQQSGGQQSGDKQNETTSAAEPYENDIEGEMVFPSGGIELPIVKP